MELILGGLVLILSNFISFKAGKNFAPTALALAAAQREWAYEKDQYDSRYYAVIREKNNAIEDNRALQRTNLELAMDPETNPQLKLTEKIKGLADRVERSF